METSVITPKTREEMTDFAFIADAASKAPRESSLDMYKRTVRTALAYMADSSNYNDKDLIRKALGYNKTANSPKNRKDLSDLAAQTGILVLKTASNGFNEQATIEGAIDYAAEMFNIAKKYEFSPLMIDSYQAAKKLVEDAESDIKVNERFGVAF